MSYFLRKCAWYHLSTESESPAPDYGTRIRSHGFVMQLAHSAPIWKENSYPICPSTSYFQSIFILESSTSQRKVTMLKLCTLLRVARPSFHISCLTARYTHVARSTKMKCLAGRRWQSTDMPKVKRTWLKNIWNSPIGVKTVHFW